MRPFEKQLIGESPELNAMLRTAQIAALTNVPIMVSGESGSGKSLLARTLHEHGPKRHGPLVEVPCATLGSGALEQAWLEAEGGTLVLDNVEELPAEAQATLLALLDRSPDSRHRDEKGRWIDVRLIVTCTRDPYDTADAGTFRNDLYFRLKVVPLELLRLRDRMGDAALLFKHFALEFARRYDKPQAYLSKRAEQAFTRYSWPGNVRELRNLCERLTILFGGREIDVTNLPREFQATKPRKSRFELPETGLSLDDLERDMIQQALSRTEGNRSRAARLLGITRDTLLYRLKKYALH